MNNDTLFPTQEQKDMAVQAMNELKKDARFMVLCRWLDANIEFLTKRLAEEDFESLEAQREVKIKRQAYIDVRNTPDKIIRQFTEQPVEEQTELTFDPYDTRESMLAERAKNG